MDRPHTVRLLIAQLCLLALLAAADYKAQSSTVLRLPEERTTTQLTGQRIMYTGTRANGVRRAGIDSNLQKYAVQRLLSGHSHTAVAYNVSLPPSLQGITCHVMRLRAGSLRRRGVSFNNFYIPSGVLVRTGGPFVLMIYKSIPLSLRSLLYSLPPGYTLISPILGLVIYTSLAPTSFNTSSSEMSLFSPTDNPPISITIPIDASFNDPPSQEAPLCAFFDINGVLSFSNLSSAPSTCSSSTLRDVALVLSSSNSNPNPPAGATNGTSATAKHSKASSTKAWRVALIAVVASFCGFAVMGATVMVGIRVQDKRQVAKMVKEPADHQETLNTSVIGHTRAPTAPSVRTKPTLETESLKT